MKFVLLLTALLSFTSPIGQSDLSQKQIVSYKAKISLAQGADRLVLMDSLSELTKDRMDLGYDSIARATATYALALDSLDLATYTAARLVWSWANRNGAPEKGVSYFTEFIKNDLSGASPAALARLYLNGGDGFYFSGQIERSIDIYSDAADYATKANDTILLAISKKYTADAYARMGKLAEGSNLLSEVESIYRQKGDTIRMINTQSSRADLYSMGGFFDLAKNERDQLIPLAKEANYLPGLLAALLNQAIDDEKTDNYAGCIENLTSAIALAKNTELYDQYEPRLTTKLLEVYSVADSLAQAQKLVDQIALNPERYSTGEFAIKYKRSIAEYNLKQGQLNTALSAALEFLSLVEKGQSFEDTMGAHEVLSRIYQEKGEPQRALFHYQAFRTMQDSLLSLQQRQALTYYQTLYETEKRDAQIAAQDSEISILDAENKLKNQWLIFGGLGLIAIFTILYLLRTQQFVRKKQALQRLFSRSLIQNQEDERTRVARELHDSVGQKLMLLTKKINATEEEETAELAKNTLEELRGISRGLHPSTLRRLGLKSAIENLINEFDKNTDLLYSYEIDDISSLLDKDSELQVYRIIQESLNNTIKHAQATAVEVELKRENGNIQTLIADNGKGFNVTESIKANSLGMKTLLERSRMIKADLHIDSTEDKGTRVHLKVPLN